MDRMSWERVQGNRENSCTTNIMIQLTVYESENESIMGWGIQCTNYKSQTISRFLPYSNNRLPYSGKKSFKCALEPDYLCSRRWYQKIYLTKNTDDSVIVVQNEILKLAVGHSVVLNKFCQFSERWMNRPLTNTISLVRIRWLTTGATSKKTSKICQSLSVNLSEVHYSSHGIIFAITPACPNI